MKNVVKTDFKSLEKFRNNFKFVSIDDLCGKKIDNFVDNSVNNNVNNINNKCNINEIKQQPNIELKNNINNKNETTYSNNNSTSIIGVKRSNVNDTENNNKNINNNINNNKNKSDNTVNSAKQRYLDRKKNS
jgi:hypothetical protein